MSERFRNSSAHHQGEQSACIKWKDPDLHPLCDPSEDDGGKQNTGIGC